MRTHNWIGGPQKQDLIGKRFGRLLVINYYGRVPYPMDKNHKTQPAWICNCDCGKKVIKTSRALLHDGTKSCRCLQKEIGSVNGRKNIKPSTFINRYYKIYVYQAKRKGISWNLTIKEFTNYILQDCYLCGQSPEPKSLCRAKYYKEDTSYNGIDRLDSSKGYSLENCRPCCSRCNKLKLDLSLKEFLLHIKKIIRYRIVHEEDK